MSKEANVADITSLELTDLVAALKEANEHYAELTDTRATGRSEAQTDDSKTVRAQMDALYDDLITRIMAVNIITPCTEAETFLKLHNQIVTETQNAFALRSKIASKSDPSLPK